MKEFDFNLEGIDYWSRPVFKCTTLSTRIGSVDILVPNKELNISTPDEISEYFRNNTDKLCIFGNSFDEHDPLGTNIRKDIKINIL